jgi:hypothetical protein
MTDEKSQTGTGEGKRFLRLSGATEEDVDAFIDSLLDEAAQMDKDRVDPDAVVRKTLRDYGVDPSQVAHYWSQKASTGDREGVLVVVEIQSGTLHAVINCPVLPLVQKERALQPEALPALSALTDGMPAGCVSARNGYVTYTTSYPLGTMEEDQIPHIFRRLHNRLQRVKNALMIAYERYFGADQAEIDKMILLPVLPDISLSDEDAKRIHYFLLQADQRARDLFVYLMEKWAGMGYIVGTTPQSIVLDAPYGENDSRVRLSILQSGLSQNVADYFEGEGYEPIPPSIILRWASLREQDGIPADAFATYEQKVTDALKLRLTSSSAHVQEVLEMDQVAAEKLLEAMGAMVISIDHTAVKPKKRAPRSTPSRVQASLELCDPSTRARFERLIGACEVSDGTVQCTKIGRIYLKMHTRPHKTGDLARLVRRFNILTLVCPQQGSPASIQVAWGLADAEHPAAYLDCIPDAVESFEETVSGLPGFERQGSVTRLVLDKAFTDAHMDQLVWAVMRLKSAEKSGP